MPAERGRGLRQNRAARLHSERDSQARHLFQMIACLQEHEGVRPKVTERGYAVTAEMAAQLAVSEGAGEFGR